MLENIEMKMFHTKLTLPSMLHHILEPLQNDSLIVDQVDI